MKLCVTLDNKPTRTFLLSKGEQKPAFQKNFRFQWVTNSVVTFQPCQCGNSSIDLGESQASVRKELGAQGQLGSLLPLWHETDTWRPSAAMEELDIRSSRDHSRDEKKPQHILYPQSHPRQLSHWFHNGREGMSARTGNDWPHFVCIQKQRGLYVSLSWPFCPSSAVFSWGRRWACPAYGSAAAWSQRLDHECLTATTLCKEKYLWPRRRPALLPG